jgi:hypothetical protein
MNKLNAKLASEIRCVNEPKDRTLKNDIPQT